MSEEEWRKAEKLLGEIIIRTEWLWGLITVENTDILSQILDIRKQAVICQGDVRVKAASTEE